MHALVDATNAIVRYHDFGGEPAPDLAPEKGLRWLPVIDTDPPCDPTTQAKDGPTITVTETAVERVWTVRAKTAEELAADLAAEKANAIEQINREAGEQRAQHITVTIGQEGTYVEKDREAAAYLAASAPDDADYPYLSAEARHTGMTVREVAELVKATADQWTALNAEIEGIRRGALVRVENAATVEEVRTVFPIAWPSPAV